MVYVALADPRGNAHGMTSPVNREGTIDDPTTGMSIDTLLDQEHSYTIPLPHRLADPTVTLLASTGVNPDECARLAQAVHDATDHDVFLPGPSTCQAVLVALTAIAETALPEAPEAERLLAEYRAILGQTF